MPVMAFSAPLYFLHHLAHPLLQLRATAISPRRSRAVRDALQCTSVDTSSVKLPLLQPLLPTTRLGRRPVDLHPRRLTRLRVSLREICADLLVRLEVGFLAVPGAVGDAVAFGAVFEWRFLWV